MNVPLLSSKMTDETPSWLDTNSDNNNGTASAPPALEDASPSSPRSFSLQETAEQQDVNAGASMLRSSGGSSANPTPTELADEKELPSIVLFMRLANMAAASLLMAVSIVVMASLPSLSNWILAIYATCGGLLICCLETQLKFLRVAIALNFGFLFSSLWRFLFYVLMGSVAWQYNNLFGKIVAIWLVVTACFNAYVLCRYPSYRKVRERIAEEEDKRIEAKISGEVKKKAAASVLGS